MVDDFARKIDAICVWGEKIIASLADGSLLFFEEQPAADQQADGAPTVSTWQVTRAQKGFTKRGAQQLQTLASQPLLLSLSGEQQRVVGSGLLRQHTTPSLAVVMQHDECMCNRPPTATACFIPVERPSVVTAATAAAGHFH